MRRHARAALLALVLLPPTAHGADYRIDNAHSQATFSVRLLWREIHGRFSRIDGTLHDSLPAGSMVVDARIDVASLGADTPASRRRMLAPEFFDAARHPLIHFVSDPFPLATLEHGGALPGRLSLRGVTAPVRFALQPLRCAPTACRVALVGQLQRSAFGMTSHRATVADDVELRLDIALQSASD
ncbi:YceI family protein [Rhodanobacter geophilus]|uniref:YceI family protein n=1 Tax=Rhodanobacter geophilus TaxID=3162488 RepID=A0ABV3QVK5_9GAMM